jgi:acyl carrier protein
MNLERQVQHLIATTLKVPMERVGPGAASDNLPAWDSVGQVNVIMALEQTFDIYIEPEEFGRFTSVKAILEYLDARGVA